MGKNTRQLWKSYLDGKPSAKGEGKGTPKDSHVAKLNSFTGTVLGIDPSLRGTGICVVRFSGGQRIELLERDTIRIPASETMMSCLGKIHWRMDRILNEFPVDHVAVEQTIYVQNYRTAMILGTAKGAALGIVATREIPVFEYPPLRVKQAVVGVGRASKEQVAAMVSRLLAFEDWNTSDETDSAGVALCHGFTYRS